MEQYVWFAMTLAFGAFMFWAGQRSVKLVGQRTERYQPSPSQVVETLLPADKTADEQMKFLKEHQPSLVAPPQFRELVQNWRNQQQGGDSE